MDTAGENIKIYATEIQNTATRLVSTTDIMHYLQTTYRVIISASVVLAYSSTACTSSRAMPIRLHF